MSYHGSGNYIVLLLLISKIKYSFYRKQYETSQGINICESQIFWPFYSQSQKPWNVLTVYYLVCRFEKEMSRNIIRKDTLVISRHNQVREKSLLK